MKLDWTPAQHKLSRRFEDLARSTVAARREHHYESGTFDRDAWQALADDGLWRLPVASSKGGSGGTWWDFAAALEGITRGGGDLGFCLSLIAHAGFLRSLDLFGGSYHRDIVMPRMMAAAVGSTALTEASGGSDVSKVGTTGYPTTTGYRLLGEKAHITNAPVADVFWILGRVSGLAAKRDITVFVVERSESDMSTAGSERMLGNHSSPTGPVTFSGLEIGRDQVLGRPGDGLQLAYATIALDRLLYGIVAAAYLESLLVESLAYTRTRVAFGRPIADHQYVQRRVTNVELALETARWVSYAALGRLVDGHPEAALMSSVAKLLGSEGLAAAALDVMQIHGHIGYMTGPFTRHVRDSLGTLIAGGTSDIQRKHIFTQLYDLRGTRSVPDLAQQPAA